MHTNRLIDEKSPYLQQHAHNPVNWYPWGAEAFEKARKEDKPIFLSVGYSTCHWCHVMERESFENEAIAKILNDSFVSIKVDREERPDVDQVYMTFVQATTGGGGWPMNVFLTPDLKPFYGGTYFPPTEKYGRPGFDAVLAQIANAWKSDRAGIESSADGVIESLRNLGGATAPDDLGNTLRAKAYAQIASAFDPEYGGFGAAPKFPRPVTLEFLFRRYAGAPHSPVGEKALKMATFTLRKMAEGGMHDQLGGGFHRYSVDRFWHVPHFEKMLYDQAQLALAYVAAFQITREPVFEETARDILDYVLRDMTDPKGGFYSAEDADSQIAADSEEHAEGAFYVWTQAEIEKALGADSAEIFAYRYGVEEDGNTPPGSDPHGEFEDKNILVERRTIEETARKFAKSPDEIEQSLEKSKQTLFEIREKRPRPLRDDKIVTAWNGLMISAFARASQVFDDKRYAQAATRAAEFAHSRLRREDDWTLVRSYRQGAGNVGGFADDYAFLIQGLLDLYETTFEVKWLAWAEKLQTLQDKLFLDDKAGGYFTTTGADPSILIRAKPDYDGAEPSPNSVAALNLLRLAKMLDREEWQERGRKTIEAFASQLDNAPSAMPAMLIALDWLRSSVKQIVITGKPDAPDTRTLLAVVRDRYAPNEVVLLADGAEGQAFLAKHVDFMEGIVSISAHATAFVCENFVCQLPTKKPEVLRSQLDPPKPKESAGAN